MVCGAHPTGFVKIEFNVGVQCTPYRDESFFFSNFIMPNYKRPFERGGMFFFTLVTHRRRHLFSTAMARRCLHKAIIEEQKIHPFDLTAIVLLPDHLHCIWQLSENDDEFSKKWGRIKSRFSKMWMALGGKEAQISRSRNQRHERGIWQKRFWEHRIRDEEDLMRHVNYIHFNPVKHGFVRCPHEWSYSSFEKWIKQGYYKRDWLCDCNVRRMDVPELMCKGEMFGE